MPTKKEKQPLSVTHPELAKQAVGWDPSTLTFGSNKKVAWKCSNGHIWEESLVKRSTRGFGCPFCSGNRVLVGFNDLATTHPEIIKEANGWNVNDYSAGSNKKVSWICSLGHIWDANIAARTGKLKTGCPFCANQKVLTGFNDLATKFPHLTIEADGWDPTKIISGSNKKFKWKCQFGHKWTANASSRTSQGTGCPVCSNHKVETGFNDLATLHPELAKEAFGWDPTEINPGSPAKLQWKCSNGHIYSAPPSQRIGRNTGCPICANKTLLVGFNDLSTTHPELAREAFGWDPSEVNAGRGLQKSGKTNQKRMWKCSLGHIWEATPASRTNTHHQSGCPFCSGNSNLSGFNDLGTTHPEIAREAYGWDPGKSRGAHNKRHEWLCPLGHIYKQTITVRMQGGGCLYCQNDLILKGFNDLKTLNPRVAMEADGWDPTTITDASQKVMPWKCSEGHKWKTTVGNRKAGKNCPTCATSGFDPNLSGWLYFLRHSNWEMFQIGITNFPDDRLGKHVGRGWEVIEIRGPMDGHTAREWETAILRMLKSKGADLSNEKIAGKFDGYSEAWSKSTFEVKSIKELMKLTEEFENQ